MRAADTVDAVIKWSIAALFFVMIICVFAGVVNRVFIKATLAWPEEASRYAMVWIAFLTVSIGLRRGAHIGVEVLVSRMTGKLRRSVSILAHICVFLFALATALYSVPIIGAQISSDQRSAALGMPMYLPYLAVPVGMMLAAIEELKAIIKEIRSGAA